MRIAGGVWKQVFQPTMKNQHRRCYFNDLQNQATKKVNIISLLGPCEAPTK